MMALNAKPRIASAAARQRDHSGVKWMEASVAARYGHDPRPVQVAAVGDNAIRHDVRCSTLPQSRIQRGSDTLVEVLTEESVVGMNKTKKHLQAYNFREEARQLIRSCIRDPGWGRCAARHPIGEEVKRILESACRLCRFGMTRWGTVMLRRRLR